VLVERRVLVATGAMVALVVPVVLEVLEVPVELAVAALSKVVAQSLW
jgi:hypothetical protein